MITITINDVNEALRQRLIIASETLGQKTKQISFRPADRMFIVECGGNGCITPVKKDAVKYYNEIQL